LDPYQHAVSSGVLDVIDIIDPDGHGAQQAASAGVVTRLIPRTHGEAAEEWGLILAEIACVACGARDCARVRQSVAREQRLIEVHHAAVGHERATCALCQKWIRGEKQKQQTTPHYLFIYF
jgi:hypothetical protein